MVYSSLKFSKTNYLSNEKNTILQVVFVKLTTEFET